MQGATVDQIFPGSRGYMEWRGSNVHEQQLRTDLSARMECHIALRIAGEQRRQFMFVASVV